MKCAACGSTALVGGKLVGEDVIGFQPGDAPWLKRIFAVGNRDISAYGCLHCQHLQLAVEFSESDLKPFEWGLQLHGADAHGSGCLPRQKEVQVQNPVKTYSVHIRR